MSGISVQREGFVKVQDLLNQLVVDLTANGFTRIFPAAAFNANSDKVVTLEASVAIDPLNTGANPQPWRIAFKVVNDYRLNAYAATPLQLTDTGTIAKMEYSQGAQLVESSGVMGSDAVVESGAFQWFPENHFIDRSARIPDAATAASYPMSYRLSTSDHGVALFVWEQASDGSPLGKFSWFCIQRPVDRDTGAVLTNGKAPVFCVYSMKNDIRKFVVREADIVRPTSSVSATEDTEDSKAIINDENQVSINEDSKYVVTCPNGLNTPRYVYTEELDMIGYTSADVVSEYSDVPLRLYSETADRIYKAMKANGDNNTGMRILMLKQGPSTVPSN